MTLNMIPANQLDTPAQIFKILTHPGRIAILELLRDGEHCVCHLEAYLGLRQATISQQLAVLRDAGIIQDRRDGWNIYYRVVNPQIFAVVDAARTFTAVPIADTAKPPVTCPCPHCAAQAE
ncbi:MAG TPA: metalloregulator ArsR/SmtB family transcription factor [Bellilinea sp.]